MKLPELPQEILADTLNQFEELASITEKNGEITRSLLSPAMAQASKKLQLWMQNYGLQTQEDKIGNIIAQAKFSENNHTFLCGSHYDTVINAGKYDGPLGILCALSAIRWLKEIKAKLNYNISLLAFADEEGTRFHTPYLGSKFIFSKFDQNALNCKDKSGKSLLELLKEKNATQNTNPFKKQKIIGYLEAHIEQGRNLEQKNTALASVSAIAGQNRAEVTLTGQADHAGNTPMNLRQDSLCATAKIISYAEKLAKKYKMVITVGKITNLPNSSNTVPEKTTFTLDIRSQKNKITKKATKKLKLKIKKICKKRKIKSLWNPVLKEKPIKCDYKINKILKQAIKSVQNSSPTLVSGAGHDGVILSNITPFSMLFVRCKKGISHHPSEYVNPNDIKKTIQALTAFFLLNNNPSLI